MKVPDFFKIKSGRARNNYIPLVHHVKTTTDFFRLKPLVCREVVPGDDMKVTVRSFCRMTPMPFPTFGRIKFHNKVFFVPYRLIMEGFTHFIEDVTYPTSSGHVSISSVPYFTNKSLAETLLYYAVPVSDDFFWRPILGQSDNFNGTILTDSYGQILLFYSTSYDLFFTNNGGVITAHQVLHGVVPAGFEQTWEKYWYTNRGSYTVSYVSQTNVNTFNITDSDLQCFYRFEGTAGIGGSTAFSTIGDFVAGTFSQVLYVYPVFSSVEFDKVAYDFKFGDLPYRFNNTGRIFYDLLISLGYRVDFTSALVSGTMAFTNQNTYSAGKLLAFVKVYLDWYCPAQYAQENSLQMLFYGVSSSGKVITTGNLKDIAAAVSTASYDRDYFTGAWQNPSGPNVPSSSVSILDNTVEHTSISSEYNKSKIINTESTTLGSNNGTPVLTGVNTSGVGASTPLNVSYYILESLRAMTNYMRRHQLSGYRVIDRYLADHGYKISDDRVQRSYYLGSDSFDAEIQDIMSTADTDLAALGDYAGKGTAYSGDSKFIRLDKCEEYGYLIVVSTVIPEIGYVQGYMRENCHLSRMQFFQGDFDNLGTQAIEKGELFADGNMKSLNSQDPMLPGTWKEVFGFSPRYAEYKIGYDFLTGDFAIPSRREGMDAFHLYRLFPDGALQSIRKSFCIGEQDQYDRIFNNTDPDYDHFRMEHYIQIDAQRPMKSLSDVYDFEHSEGIEMKVDANGVQLN